MNQKQAETVEPPAPIAADRLFVSVRIACLWCQAYFPPADLAGTKRYPFACMHDVSKLLSSARSSGAFGGGICTDALPLGPTATLGINTRAGGDIRDAVKRACHSQRAKSSLRIAGSVSGLSHSN